jgi:hypothetical protein
VNAATPIKARVARAALAACGAYQIALGAYFMALRPSFLPEDLRFVGGSAAEIDAAAPGLAAWLQWVFAVMGGQMAGVGLLALAVVVASGPRRAARPVELVLLGLAAVSTAGLMSAVNFAIGSDFRWLLVLPVALWALALFCQLRSVPDARA